jgi:hypothetical protein
MATNIAESAPYSGRESVARQAAFEVVRDARAGTTKFGVATSIAASLMEDILSSADHFARISERSYAHPNGFEKIVLAPGSFEDGELRLHVWQVAGRSPDSKVHDHAWDLVSLVLSGALIVRQFDAVAQGPLQLATARPYEFREASYDLQADEQTYTAVETSSHVMLAGSFYRLAAASLHSADPLEANTITLACQGPFVRPACRVMFGEGHELSERIGTTAIDDQRLKAILEQAHALTKRGDASLSIAL